MACYRYFFLVEINLIECACFAAAPERISLTLKFVKKKVSLKNMATIKKTLLSKRRVEMNYVWFSARKGFIKKYKLKNYKCDLLLAKNTIHFKIK